MGTPFLPKKNPGGRAGGLAPGVRVHHFTIFLKFFWQFLKLFGIIWDASRGSLEVVRSNFCQTYVRTFHLLKKCLGGSRRVLGVPQTILKNINLSGNLILFNLFFAYCIAYCIAYWFRLESLGPIHSAWIAHCGITAAGLCFRESRSFRACASEKVPAHPALGMACWHFLGRTSPKASTFSKHKPAEEPRGAIQYAMQ